MDRQTVNDVIRSFDYAVTELWRLMDRFLFDQDHRDLKPFL